MCLLLGNVFIFLCHSLATLLFSIAMTSTRLDLVTLVSRSALPRQERCAKVLGRRKEADSEPGLMGLLLLLSEKRSVR